MEINMKKQEEIFHEIQDMMGETKEGRIRWSVEDSDYGGKSR